MRALRTPLAAGSMAAIAVAGMGGVAAAAPARPFGSGTQRAIAGASAPCTLGQVLLTAGPVAEGVPANGQILNIAPNPILFSLIGSAFGGDPQRGTFALPKLNAAAPNGMTYAICTKGTYPRTTDEPVGNRPDMPNTPLALDSPAFGADTQRARAGEGAPCVVGQLMLTAARLGNGIPANGQLLSSDSYPTLFSLLGYKFGGHGTEFALPQLKDAAPSGLTYSVCANGYYPSALGSAGVGPLGRRHRPRLSGAISSPFGTDTQSAVAGYAYGSYCTVGAVSLYAGRTVDGTPANGQLLKTTASQALYAAIGNAYGGVYPATFALPELGLAAPNGMTYAICPTGVFPNPNGSAAPGSARPGDRDHRHSPRRDGDGPGRI